jgi:hypothetical protein
MFKNAFLACVHTPRIDGPAMMLAAIEKAKEAQAGALSWP